MEKKMNMLFCFQEIRSKLSIRYLIKLIAMELKEKFTWKQNI